MKGKHAIGIILFFIIILTFLGCNSEKQLEPRDLIKDEFEGVVTLWITSAGREVVNNAAKQYMEKHKNAKIEVLIIPEEELDNRLSANVSSGKDVPDIILVQKSLVQTYVRMYPSSFMELTGEFSGLKDKFIKSQLQGVTTDSKLMAVPWDVAPIVMFYRKDVLTDNGISIEDIKTWDDYIIAGKKIVDKTGGKVKMLPLNLQENDELIRLLLNQLGEGYFIRDGKKNIHLLNYIKAFNLLKNIQGANIVYNTKKDTNIIEEFKRGNIASVPNSAELASTFIENHKDFAGKLQVKTLPAFEPGGKTSVQINGSAFMITKVSKNQKVALDFIKYISAEKEIVINSVKKDGIYPSVWEFYNEKWASEEIEYFNFQRVWRLVSEGIEELDDAYYPAGFKEAQKNVLKAQIDILTKSEDLKSIVDQLLDEMPVLK